VDAIECKWQPDAFETRGLTAFRASYPRGRNYLVSPLVTAPYQRRVDAHLVEFLPLVALRERLRT
jgi:hypothetical protein